MIFPRKSRENARMISNEGQHDFLLNFVSPEKNMNSNVYDERHRDDPLKLSLEKRPKKFKRSDFFSFHSPSPPSPSPPPARASLPDELIINPRMIHKIIYLLPDFRSFSSLTISDGIPRRVLRQSVLRRGEGSR